MDTGVVVFIGGGGGGGDATRKKMACLCSVYIRMINLTMVVNSTNI